MFKKTVRYYHLNSNARFSKKYPNTKVEDIFKKDPDYLLYCRDVINVAFAEEVNVILNMYKNNKEKRNIKKVTCFK